MKIHKVECGLDNVRVQREEIRNWPWLDQCPEKDSVLA
jgi:hypothetical protein